MHQGINKEFNMNSENNENNKYTDNEFEYNPYIIFKENCKTKNKNLSISYANEQYCMLEVLTMIDNFSNYLQKEYLEKNNQLHLKTNEISNLNKKYTHTSDIKAKNVLFSAKNHPLLLITYLACAKIGHTFIPINPLLSEEDKEYILEQTKPYLHINSENLKIYYDKCWNCPNEDNQEKQNSNNGKLIKKHPNTNENTNEIGAILFTSGTSGKPKGVQLSYKNLWWGTKNLREGFKYNYNDKALIVAPMSHIGGFNGCTIDLLINGAGIYIPQTLEAEELIEIIVKQKITLMFAVPTIYEKILSIHSEEDFSSLRLPLTGGSPVSKAIIEKAKAHGLRLLPVWGMTEISASGAYLPQIDIEDKPNNVALPL